jgi:hypothetical protein
MFWQRRVVSSISLLLTLVLTLAAPLVGRAAPSAQDARPVLNVNAGFDGYYKDGLWMPVRVLLENNGPDVAGQVRIASPGGFGNVETLVTRPVDLPTQSRRSLQLFVAPEGFNSKLDVELVDSNGRRLAAVPSQLSQLSANDLLYGLVANASSAYLALNDVDPVNGRAAIAQLDVEDLPAVGAAWQALDVLVVSDIDTGGLTPEQRRALGEWVHMGGRLIVAGGPSWQKTAAGLGDLLPLIPDGARSVADVQALADFAKSVEALTGSAVIATGPLTADAVILAEADGLPLVVARRLGFGEVIYLASDPAFAPLRGWGGVADLFRRLLSTVIDRPSWAFGITNWSQAGSAINRIPDLVLPNPLLICGFLGFYLIVVGPLNYMVLRFFKRRELAWFTIPAIVCAFSIVAYLTGLLLLGGQAVLHQLSIVQVWHGASQARVEQVVGVFSPARTTYDLEFSPGFLARPVPGSSAPGPASVQVEQGERTRLLGVRSDIGSVQAFAVQGFTAAPQFDASLEIKITGGAGELRGTVTNQSTLTLQDAVLLAPGGALRLGELKPGESRQISLSLSSSRASSAPPNAVLPFSAGKGGAFGSPSPAPPYYSPYSTTYDTTIDDILGTANYYQDREQMRRYELLSSAINVYGSTGGLGRGNGIYLAGWTDSAPAPARLLNAGFRESSATLYLIALPSATRFTGGAVTLLPGMLTWSPRPLGGNDPHLGQPPYDLTLYAGEQYAVRFTPRVVPGPLTKLVLNLYGSNYGSSPGTPPQVELWDFRLSKWVTEPLNGFGSFVVAEPERYSGPDGEIEVRLYNPGPDTLQITQLDFDLTFGP